MSYFYHIFVIFITVKYDITLNSNPSYKVEVKNKRKIRKKNKTKLTIFNSDRDSAGGVPKLCWC